ncbi:YggT family protein [Pararhizobium sp. IMCC21322]|uniref:YggT family protein n=1 Tax=Pararhizobium sp. IMCC21322 TaxID=3067903 RepID=UPI002741D4E0|nr:YggT family protein [Pararhizobium sp. IMCC21322]
MRAILDVILVVLQLYVWVLIISAVFSWLYAFNVINSSNQVVATIGNMLHQFTEPVLSRVRRFVPAFGTIDISPIIVILGIFLLQNIIRYYIYPNVF